MSDLIKFTYDAVVQPRLDDTGHLDVRHDFEKECVDFYIYIAGNYHGAVTLNTRWEIVDSPRGLPEGILAQIREKYSKDMQYVKSVAVSLRLDKIHELEITIENLKNEINEMNKEVEELKRNG